MSKIIHLDGGGGALLCVSVCVMWCVDLSPLIGQDRS